MITDEERRVVASSLRESANVGGARTLKRELAKALGIRLDACTSEGSHTKILRGLAELIDRPTCQMVECTIDHGSRSCGMRCTACGKEFEHMKPGFGWRFCHSCGAEVVDE